MSSRSIGKIISINNKVIIAEMYDNIGSYLNTIEGVKFVGEIGSYVTIEEIGRRIIAEIIGVEDKNLSSKEQFSKPINNRYVQINLLGEIINNQFFFGVSKMPLIFSEINIINELDFKIMHELEDEEEIIKGTEKTRLKLLSIGQSVIFPEYDVKINIDKFFGFHFSIFGNTGAGKSNTLARIIQNIFIKNNNSAKGAKIIFIDSNGEYESAFEKINEDNKDINVKFLSSDSFSEFKERIEIPVWALTVDDWSILLNASEKTQVPILKRAIDIAKIFFNPENIDNSIKNHILSCTILGILNSSDTSPSKSDKLKAILTRFYTNELNLGVLVSANKSLRQCIQINYGQFLDLESLQIYCSKYLLTNITDLFKSNVNVIFDLSDFINVLDFAVLYEGSISSQRIQEYTSTLTARLQALSDSDNGKIFVKTRFTTIDDYINNLIGNNQILNINISSLDDYSSEVVSKVITKMLFDFQKKKIKKAETPINLIIEEAHRFVKEETNLNSFGYNIFEKVAKEGRKFGLLLGISSQRPYELSKTVVSQCSNFIIHRIQNPDDLYYISRMVPYINQSIIDRLTYLPTGTALVFGTAINIPTLTKFSIANPQTDSLNAKISYKWFIE